MGSQSDRSVLLSAVLLCSGRPGSFQPRTSGWRPRVAGAQPETETEVQNCPPRMDGCRWDNDNNEPRQSRDVDFFKPVSEINRNRCMLLEQCMDIYYLAKVINKKHKLISTVAVFGSHFKWSCFFSFLIYQYFLHQFFFFFFFFLFLLLLLLRPIVIALCYILSVWWTVWCFISSRSWSRLVVLACCRQAGGDEGSGEEGRCFHAGSQSALHGVDQAAAQLVGRCWGSRFIQWGLWASTIST